MTDDAPSNLLIGGLAVVGVVLMAVGVGRPHSEHVWSRSYGRKISQTTDARCDDLPELRRRMRAAIARGDCD